MSKSEFDPYLGVTKAAVYLGVHRSTISRYVRSGRLKPDGRMPNGDVRLKQSTLDRFVANEQEAA